MASLVSDLVIHNTGQEAFMLLAMEVQHFVTLAKLAPDRSDSMARCLRSPVLLTNFCFSVLCFRDLLSKLLRGLGRGHDAVCNPGVSYPFPHTRTTGRCRCRNSCFQFPACPSRDLRWRYPADQRYDDAFLQEATQAFFLILGMHL